MYLSVDFHKSGVLTLELSFEQVTNPYVEWCNGQWNRASGKILFCKMTQGDLTVLVNATCVCLTSSGNIT